MGMGIDAILDKAGARRASDILLTANEPPMLVVLGEVEPLDDVKLNADEVRQLVYSLLNKDQIRTLEETRELDFGFTYHDRCRFRGNAFWQRGSVGAAMRLIPRSIPTLDDLNVPPILRQLTTVPQGLVLITGPTGHGKSTTQAAMIDHVNRNRAAHIVTVEDPIEFLHTNRKSIIEQREVGLDTHSFAGALRHVLRQAPHVILVGEMRDLETIGIALTSAETGHLVISTLHTNDAAQCIDRIIDTFSPHQQNQVRSQLSSCLLAVVAQRLLPRSDGKGRVLACEVLRNSPAVANLIRENKASHLPGVIETQGKLGMVSFDNAIKKLFLAGEITEECARRHMKHPQTLFGGGR